MAHNSSSSSSNAMAVVTGAAGQFVADMIKGPVDAFMGQIDALINMEPNNQLMRDNRDRLKNLSQDISNNFRDNENTAPSPIIQSYLGKMHILMQKAEGISNAKIPSLIPELAAEMEKLLNDLSIDLSISANARATMSPKEADVLLQPGPEFGFVGKEIETAETQLKTWISAEPSEVRLIGVYGMPGVGKTSLLQRVYNFYKVSNVFDVVIWLTVSRDYGIRDLQGRIAKELKLDLSGISDLDTDKPKMMLSASLIKRKFLLIFDDIWAALDLQKLGVAFGTTKGSKVVFSTRSTDLTLMNSEKSIKVDPLSREEGWELFERVAFKSGHVPEELKKCARKIADECECLPLAITVVATVMRGKGRAVEDWNTCLSLMENADISFADTHPHVNKGLYGRIRWSYEDLPTHLQSCFLYCAMYPEDEEIWVDELVRMWIAEGFVISCRGTYSTNMELGRGYVKLLIDRSLFQSVDFERQGMDISVKKPVNVWKKRFIRVHDVIRDVAIYIGEQQKNSLCRAGLQLEDFPRTQTRDWKRMSLHRNQIESVPENFPYTQLLSLILSKNPLTYKVGGRFLTNLTALRVLDLSNTQIETVPTSFSQLEFLKLRCTCIRELPREIGNLSNLQFLDISECKYLTSVPAEISQLTSLKTLYLSLGMENAVGDHKDVIALKDLKNLIELHLYMFFKFENHEIMGTIMGSWVKMRHLYLHYNHMIPLKCNLPEGMQNMKNLQSLVLCGYRGTQLPKWICEFQQLERLELDSWHNVKKLPPLESLPNLKFLKLSKHPTVKDLGIGDHGLENGFPKLEMLHLSDIPKLVKIGVLEEGILPHLHLLKVKKCPRLKNSLGGVERLKRPRMKTSLGGVERLPSLYGHTSWWGKIEWD